jgi:hypothetical protein
MRYHTKSREIFSYVVEAKGLEWSNRGIILPTSFTAIGLRPRPI